MPLPSISRAIPCRSLLARDVLLRAVLVAVVALLALGAVVGCGQAGMDAYEAGVIAANDGDLIEAERHLKEAIAQYPEFTEAHLGLAIVYLKLADRETESTPVDHRVVEEYFENAKASLLDAKRFLEEGYTIQVADVPDDRKLAIIESRLDACETYLELPNLHHRTQAPERESDGDGDVGDGDGEDGNGNGDSNGDPDSDGE